MVRPPGVASLGLVRFPDETWGGETEVALTGDDLAGREAREGVHTVFVALAGVAVRGALFEVRGRETFVGVVLAEPRALGEVRVVLLATGVEVEGEFLELDV